MLTRDLFAVDNLLVFYQFFVTTLLNGLTVFGDARLPQDTQTAATQSVIAIRLIKTFSPPHDFHHTPISLQSSLTESTHLFLCRPHALLSLTCSWNGHMYSVLVTFSCYPDHCSFCFCINIFIDFRKVYAFILSLLENTAIFVKHISSEAQSSSVSSFTV